MAESAKKKVYRTFVEEVINKGRTELIPDLFSPDYVDHNAPPGAPTGGDVYEQIAHVPQLFRGAFPDMIFTIEHMVAEDDKVAIHLVGRGTHEGELHGLPPTGKRVTIGGAAIHRIEGSKIVETYQVVDRLSLREQLGAPQMGDIDVE